jgi:hypothetical protein
MEDWVARKSKPNQKLDTWTRRFNHTVASIRAIGEHPFRILKRQFLDLPAPLCGMTDLGTPEETIAWHTRRQIDGNGKTCNSARSVNVNAKIRLNRPGF